MSSPIYDKCEVCDGKGEIYIAPVQEAGVIVDGYYIECKCQDIPDDEREESLTEE